MLNAPIHGGLAQLVRALASHARGHRFKSVSLHQCVTARDDSCSRSLRSLLFSGVPVRRRTPGVIVFYIKGAFVCRQERFLYRIFFGAGEMDCGSEIRFQNT